MNCNCNNTENEAVIEFIQGTSQNLYFEFDDTLEGFTSAIFTIRENYGITPVISKNITIEDTKSNILPLILSKTETAQFTKFQNGRTSANYIWGLDLLTDSGEQINVFPQTGEAAPLCIVYKHVVEG